MQYIAPGMSDWRDRPREPVLHHSFPSIRTTGLVALMLAPLLGGCTSLAVGAGATVGTAVAQERSVGHAVDDVKISTQIHYHWLRHDKRLLTKVDLEVHEGVVVLTGTVATPEERVDVVRLAWQADGIRELINEIEVADTSGIGDWTRDGWITTQLTTRLLFDREVLSVNYSAETVNGVVYLMGIAQDGPELIRVTEHARNVPYVRRIVSHVRLKSDPRRTS